MARKAIRLTSKVERVWAWLFPTVLVALAPVVAHCLIGLLNRGLVNYSFQNFVTQISPRGELLIVAVTLVAESMSDLWRRQITKWQKDLIGALCLAFVILATIVFASLPIIPLNVLYISNLSCVLFSLGLLLCVFCKIAGRS